MNATARFRFHGDLTGLLPRERRGGEFAYACAQLATLKNAIEALGVPHTEIGALRVDGEPATLSRIVREGDAVDVHPWPPGAAIVPEGEPRFLADAHLGGLARFLRMLGFDTLFDPALADAAIERVVHDEQRILLTRDRELLKCRDVLFGCFVRTLRPEDQLREVVARYALHLGARPLTRCLHCNVPLESVEKTAIEHRLPEQVRALQRHFAHCRGCDRIYWPGSHYARMRAALRDLLPALGAIE